MKSNIDLSLESECSRCGGTGSIWNIGAVKSCPCVTCEGTGQQVTELGREILEFVQRRLKLTCKP